MRINYLLSCLFLLISIRGMAHGGHVATFKYELSDAQISLEFRIEKASLDHFNFSNQCENFEKTTALCLSNYINEKTQFNIEGKALTFELNGASQNEGFLVVSLVAHGAFSTVGDLTIHNECFIEFDKKFKNRIVLSKNGELKSYLLNRKNQDLNL